MKILEFLRSYPDKEDCKAKFLEDKVGSIKMIVIPDLTKDTITKVAKEIPHPDTFVTMDVSHACGGINLGIGAIYL